MLTAEVAAVTNRLLTKIAASQVAVVRTRHASIGSVHLLARPEGRCRRTSREGPDHIGQSDDTVTIFDEDRLNDENAPGIDGYAVFRSVVAASVTLRKRGN